MRDIDVRYKNVGGLHVFTSPDVKGLYVASMDAKEAFEEVAEGLEILLLSNEGLKVRVEPSVTVSDFLRVICASDDDVPHPAVIEAARFRFSGRNNA